MTEVWIFIYKVGDYDLAIVAMYLFRKNVHSVQTVNSVLKYLFYLLFVCILIFSIYPMQLFPLHISLKFYVFIALFHVYFIDNIDVTINKWASILQTLGSPYAYCSSWDGVARRQASLTFRYQFLSSQYVMTRRFLPMALYGGSLFCLTSLLSCHFLSGFSNCQLMWYRFYFSILMLLAIL